MLSVQRCRRILGAEAQSLSDEEIERIREAMMVLADIAIAAAVAARRVPSTSSSAAGGNREKARD